MESEEKKAPVTPPADASPEAEPPVQEGEPEGAARDVEEELPSSDEDWDSRVLCSDESCIGVIGPDGRCRECGKPAGPGFTPPSEVPESAGEAAEPASPQDFGPPQDEETEAAETQDLDAELVVDDDEWRQRTLCSDESCIGVIGPDGRCRECGKPYRPEASS